MKIQRRFTNPGTDPLDEVRWDRRESVIREPDGTVVFEMRDIEVPADWSQVATDILAQKYFRKAGVPQPDGSLGRETSARQVVRRLAGCWTDWGRRYKYFDSDEDAAAFDAEMSYMLIHQMAAPNSPQWFNTGLAYAYGISGPAQGHYYVDPDTKELVRAKDSYTHPQPHACFIQSVEDDLVNDNGIMDLWVREARLFKYGSGCVSARSFVPVLGRGLVRIGDLFLELAQHRPVVNFDGKGRFVNVRDLGLKTLSLEKQTGRIIEDHIDLVWSYDVPQEDKVTVKFDTGARATVSAWHPFMVWDGREIIERRADQLIRGDAVLGPNSTVPRLVDNNASIKTISYSIPWFRKTKALEITVDSELAWLVGYFLGDGSLSYRDQRIKRGKKSYAYRSLRLRFFDEDREPLEHVARILSERFGAGSSITRDSRGKCLVLTCTKAAATAFFTTVHAPGVKGATLTLPDFIRQGNVEVQLAFLAGLVDSDGSVSEGRAVYTSESRAFVEEIAAIASLLGLGGGLIADGNVWSTAIIRRSTPVRRALELSKYLATRKHVVALQGRVRVQRRQSCMPLDADLGDKIFSERDRYGLHGFSAGQRFHVGRLAYEGVVNPTKLLKAIAAKPECDVDQDIERVRFAAEGVAFVSEVAPCLESVAFNDLTTRKANNYLAGEHGLVVIHNTGTNFSNLRAEGEKLSGGGSSSGLMSFLRVGDRAAGAIKSGGTTRRAAKMVILDIDHPDIEKFINWKVEEEKKVAALIAAGYGSSYEGDAYSTVSGQNSNNSVRIPDKFIEAVRTDATWDLLWRRDKSVARTVRARDLWDQIARAAWACADPGIQYDDIINSWHTSPAGGRIRASNPCITADTLVATDSGYQPVSELVGRQFTALVDGEHYQSTGEGFFFTGIKPVFKVRTDLGLEIKATEDHRFLTIARDGSESWRAVRDIKVGERLAIHTHVVMQQHVYVSGHEQRKPALAIEKQAHSPRTFQTVRGVTPLGNAPVYDCTIPGPNAFDANGFYAHNCSEYMFLDDTACFAPETRISTPEGLRTVKELYSKQVTGEQVLITTDVYSEHDHRRITAYRPAKITQVGKRQVFRMTLKDGRQIRATADHKFLTHLGTWKRLDELVAGKDRVQIRMSGDAVKFASPVTEVKRWQTLGWLTGDGVFSKDTVALVFAPTEEETALEMTAEMNDLKVAAAGGAGPVTRASTISTAANGVMQTYSKQSSLVSYLERHYGFKQATAVAKDVPNLIHYVSSDLKVAYLQGLFSADGTILDTYGIEKEVMLASSSPQLLRSVQLLLSDIGITSRITWTHPQGRKNPQGQLRIYNQQARRFLSLVGFPCSAYKDALAQNILDSSFAGAKKNPRAPKVVEIVADCEETVYDITEPVTHTVVAEGMVAHNCNLASINLMTFYDAEKNTLDVEAFKHACRLWTMVLEISVLMAQFPSPEIARKSYEYRTLGLGYANLGTLLMVSGIPYDSPRALAIAGAVSAILTGESYAASAEMAGELGPFSRYKENAEPMLRVMNNHRQAAYNAKAAEYEELSVIPMGIDAALCPPYLLSAARECWDRAVELGEQNGYRNAQATCIAPTGTIGLLMDCDTTGIEPDFALVKFKKLSGGGYFKIINQSIPAALSHLGYNEKQIDDIVRYAKGSGSLYGAPYINAETLRARGFTNEDLIKIEKALPTVFEIGFAFNQWTLSEETLQRLGITPEQYNAIDFDLLRLLGFNRDEIEAANNYICGTMTIEGAPHLKEEHYPAFDCANKCGKLGKRFIHHMGHVRMMAAAQPLISGALSKTINMPNEATVDEIKEAYLRSWDLGLKAIALYRDGSKLSQPLSNKGTDKTAIDSDRQLALSEEFAKQLEEARRQRAEELRPDEILAAAQRILANATNTDFKRKVAQALERNRLPAKRRGWTQKAKISGHTVFLRTGEYADGTLGEIFVDLHKEGASFRSLMNCFAIAVSIGLQYGVPLEEFVDKFVFTRFEPNGFVDHPNIKHCTSVVDYIFRVLGMEYLGRTDFVQIKPEDKDVDDTNHDDHAQVEFEARVSAQQVADETPAPRPLPSAGAVQPRAQATTGPNATVDPEHGAQLNALRSREAQMASLMGDAPLCDVCGSITRRNGACYVCDSCGRSMGCS